VVGNKPFRFLTCNLGNVNINIFEIVRLKLVLT